MANTSTVYARIDPKLKGRAEAILARLGVTPSGAIQMFYSQIVLHKGLPFDLKLPVSASPELSQMTDEVLSTQMREGLEEAGAEKAHIRGKFDEGMQKDYGI